MAGGDDRLGGLVERDVRRAAREVGDQDEAAAPHAQPAGVLVVVDRVGVAGRQLMADLEELGVELSQVCWLARCA